MPRPAIRAFLFDLSGTLHIGPTPTPTTAAALSRARQAGLTARFCSNTSQESARALRERLGSMGFGMRDGGRPGDESAEALLSDSAMEEVPEFRSAAADAEQHHALYDCPRRVRPGVPRVDHTSSSSIRAAHPSTYANVHVETLVLPRSRYRHAYSALYALRHPCRDLHHVKLTLILPRQKPCTAARLCRPRSPPSAHDFGVVDEIEEEETRELAPPRPRFLADSAARASWSSQDSSLYPSDATDSEAAKGYASEGADEERRVNSTPSQSQKQKQKQRKTSSVSASRTAAGLPPSAVPPRPAPRARPPQELGAQSTSRSACRVHVPRPPPSARRGATASPDPLADAAENGGIGAGDGGSSVGHGSASAYSPLSPQSPGSANSSGSNNNAYPGYPYPGRATPTHLRRPARRRDRRTCRIPTNGSANGSANGGGSERQWGVPAQMQQLYSLPHHHQVVTATSLTSALSKPQPAAFANAGPPCITHFYGVDTGVHRTRTRLCAAPVWACIVSYNMKTIPPNSVH
ncbi:hypothetical protein DFH11DRAFT_1547607 [Phellopilus nigrolimitatus]|nr:hypothetical protein DFH11DRAFT_1547607 [Phellopilus nigrolimitatus]